MGRESLCFALWVRAILDEKRMTGESVNFRLNQMDLLLSSCMHSYFFQISWRSLGISHRRFESCLWELSNTSDGSFAKSVEVIVTYVDVHLFILYIYIYIIN